MFSSKLELTSRLSSMAKQFFLFLFFKHQTVLYSTNKDLFVGVEEEAAYQLPTCEKNTSSIKRNNKKAYTDLSCLQVIAKGIQRVEQAVNVTKDSGVQGPIQPTGDAHLIKVLVHVVVRQEVVQGPLVGLQNGWGCLLYWVAPKVCPSKIYLLVIDSVVFLVFTYWTTTDQSTQFKVQNFVLMW